MATTKDVIKKPVEKETVAKEETVKIVRKFSANDLIEVRSITQGELLLPGKKSGILYRWSGYGDITEVEYQDLYSLKSTRSQYLYGPLFVIENDDLMEDPKWKDVKKLYEKVYGSEDMNYILNLPLDQFVKVLNNVPAGYLNSIKIAAATAIENGTFDSINKIKKLDEICGTDFMSLI